MKKTHWAAASDCTDGAGRADAAGDAALAERLARIRHVVLDLDGTVYKDDVVFEGVNDFLAMLRSSGIGYTFVTNNSSRSRQQYVTRLRGLGIDVARENVFTSGDAAIACLRGIVPEARRLFVLGTPSLHEQFVEAGYTLCPDDSPTGAECEPPRPDHDPSGGQHDLEPDAVVVGFDTTLSFSRLCKAAYWVSRGKPYVATHPDRICPTGEPTVLVDCGSICAAIAEATGRRPEAVPGKPDRLMLQGIMDAHALTPCEMAMVGDRLYTDIAMAESIGAMGVLVLTGEATADQAAARPRPPDVVAEDLAAFGRLLEGAAARGRPTRAARQSSVKSVV